MQKAKEINNLLLKKQAIWEEQCYNKLKEKYDKLDSEKIRLSCAFSFGVSEEYVNAEKKIMIIGQEANGHTFNYEKWGLIKWQDWAIDYLRYQLYGIKSAKGFEFTKNSSPFWSFFEKLNEKGYGVCWNNLDKVRRYVKTDGKTWIEDYLPYDKKMNDESIKEHAILNDKIFEGGKSLLRTEIENDNLAIKPDIVVFAVGPSNPYYHTLYHALLLGDNDYDKILYELKCFYPTKTEPCKDISGLLKINIPCYYTYHPNYLRQSGQLDKVISCIADK